MVAGTKGPWKNQLRKVRLACQFSQADLASHLSVSQSTVASIEKGKLSGRCYMDSISDFFGYRAELIFPYYHYMTLKEALSTPNISPTKLKRAIASGAIRTMQVGGKRMYYKDDVASPEHLIEVRPTVSSRAMDCITQYGSLGASTDTVLGSFGPFSSAEDREKTRKTLQVTLSRSKKFTSEKHDGVTVWKVADG